MTRITTPALASFLILSVAQSASAQDANALLPRIGETVREFEARKRGVELPKIPSVGSVTVEADRAGHFFVQPSLDGAKVRMVVDTGASIVALSYEDAKRVGIRFSAKDFTMKMATANGSVEAAPTIIREISLGDITVKNVEAVVMPEGRLGISLLGMSFLRRLRGFDVGQGRLTLRI